MWVLSQAIIIIYHADSAAPPTPLSFCSLEQNPNQERLWCHAAPSPRGRLEIHLRSLPSKEQSLSSHHAFGGVNHAESEGEWPLQGDVVHCRKRRALLGQTHRRRGVRKRRRKETLHPGYLLGAWEGVVEARDVGHDRLLVRTGSAHNVCGGKRGGQGGGGGGRGVEGGGRWSC